MGTGRAIQRLRELNRTVSGTTSVRPNLELYERTLRALDGVTPDADDGIIVVVEWIEAFVEEEGRLPPSKTVRQRAARYCRENGYDVPADSWLAT